MNWEEIPNELIFINPSSPETAAHFPPQSGSGQKFYRLHRPYLRACARWMAASRAGCGGSD